MATEDTYRLVAIRGDDEDYEVTVKDEDGVVIDLTGGTLFFTVKENKTDTDAQSLIYKTITSFDAPTTGIQIISLTHDDTDINPGDYWFDIQFKTSEGAITSRRAGKFIVERDITIRTTIDIS